MRLENKVAIITGAGSGFGKATAKLFAKEGAKVVLVGRTKEKLEQVEKEIKEIGGKALVIPADVTTYTNAEKIIEKTLEHFGKIDILFNNAGTFRAGTLETLSTEDWNDVIAVNLTALFYMGRAAIPYLKKTKGNIINTASAGGIIGFPQAVSYAASKGGVISFTKAIAVNFAKDGIRCNAICPGTSETEMTEEVMHIDALRKSFLQPIPMQRFGKGTDVAYAALYLASDESSYLTGVVLPVDGGWTMS